MFPTIETLAIAIDNAWSRVNYAENDFCEIAASCLLQPLDLDFNTIARSICEGFTLPQQRRRDQGFGQPALTLYYGERFLIEALCWHSGTPAIHQHAFSGAFRVITGQSVHSRYSFAEVDRFSQIIFGELRLESVEILNNSSTVKIPRGSSLIHSAFHLDSPSMTLVARTHQTADPELTYLPPGVAYDPSARSSSLHKRLQLLDTLSLTGHESYCDCIQAAIDNSNLYDGMAIVMRAGSHRVDEPTFRSLAERLRDLHGMKVSPVISALIEERRRSSIVRLRATVTDEESRFFLASLMSFTCRTDLLAAVVQRYGDATIAREHIAKGVSSLLGGGDRDRQIITRAAVDAMLDNVPIWSFAERAARVWHRSITVDEGVKLSTFYEQLMKHPLLSPLRNESD